MGENQTGTEPMLSGEANDLVFGLYCFHQQVTKWNQEHEPVEMQCQGALVGWIFFPPTVAWQIPFTGRVSSFPGSLAEQC